MTRLLVLLLLLWLPAPGSQDQEEAAVHFSRTAAVGGSVALDCGSVPPAIFIWGFTKPGTDTNMVLVYNYGHGSKIQTEWGHLGRMRVPANTSTLVIDDLGPDAEGMYTCQAMDDGDIRFYYSRLDLD